MARFLTKAVVSFLILFTTATALSHYPVHGRSLRRLTRLHRPLPQSNQSSQVLAKCAGSDDTTVLNTAGRTAGGGLVIIEAGVTCAAVRDLTIPNLRIEKGGLLKVATGRTVTVSSFFESGSYQTFE